MSERAVPFHCPFCGEGDSGRTTATESGAHGSWECRSCLRAFSFKMLGDGPSGAWTRR